MSSPLKMQAGALLRQGNLEQARLLYERICKESENDAESIYILGTIYGRLRHFNEVTRCMNRCLELESNVFMAYCCLGIAYKELGQQFEAENAFRNALKQQPENTNVLIELATTLLNEDKLTEAGEILDRTLAIEPESADALHGLGVFHQKQQQYDSAIEYYQQTLALNPAKPVTHYCLGNVMYILGRPEEAAQHYQQAIEINPEYTEAYTMLGDVLTRLCRAGEALDAYNRALDIRPDYIDATVGKVMLLEHENNIREAYEHLIPLINNTTRNTRVGIAYAQLCQHFDRCEDAAEYLKSLLHTQISDADKEHIYFSLGKLFDASRDYEQAFECYQRGNILKAGHYDPDRQSERFAALIDLFSRDFMESAPHSSNASESPVFIVGMPRSGTTLVEQILASHPEVHGAGELMNIMKQAESIAHKDNKGDGFPGCMKNISTNMLNDFAEEYISYTKKLAPEARRIVDKMPHNFMHLGLIALEFPNARVIHCVRDPRDTCLSIYFQYFSDSHPYATDLGHIGHYYRHYVKLMRHWMNVLDIRTMELHYEELITSKEKVSRELIEFTGLTWDERCLRHHETSRSIDTMTYDQVRKPIYNTSIARWKHYEQHLDPLFHRLGDEVS